VEQLYIAANTESSNAAVSKFLSRRESCIFRRLPSQGLKYIGCVHIAVQLEHSLHNLGAHMFAVLALLFSYQLLLLFSEILEP